MSRTIKYPGLDARFAAALRRVLPVGETLSSPSILNRIAADADIVDIPPNELEDLRRRSSNYMERAKERGIVQSHGTRGGYSILASEAGDAIQAAVPQTTTPVSLPARPMRHRESFLHFPVAIALSKGFNALVRSLPTSSDAVRWGNPDMLMIRSSKVARIDEYHDDLEPELFRSVDATPPDILSSIEVKANLNRDRQALFAAVSECAANSRWANEAWLVFVDQTSSDEPLDAEVISLGRSAEVGILEVVVSTDGQILQEKVHHVALTRPSLRIGEMGAGRPGLLLEAQLALKTWNGGTGMFKEQDQNVQMLRALVQQALFNLRRQNGFQASTGIVEFFRKLASGEAEFARRLALSSLRTAALAAEVGADADLLQVLRKAGEDTLRKSESDAFTADLSALTAVKPGEKSPLCAERNGD